MELTTGAILRRITETPLSTAAHKLATIILDGIAWKDGYNGLERGTAAFTLGSLANRMGVSRQHLTQLLAELASSALGLLRWKPHGKFAPWLFRFGAVDMNMAEGIGITLDLLKFRPDPSTVSVPSERLLPPRWNHHSLEPRHDVFVCAQG